MNVITRKIEDGWWIIDTAEARAEAGEKRDGDEYLGKDGKWQAVVISGGRTTFVKGFVYRRRVEAVERVEPASAAVVKVQQVLTVLNGHCVDKMREMEAGSVSCVVTSPPYWGLRDYGIPKSKWEAVRYRPMAGMPEIEVPAMECCLGLEDDPVAFVGHVVAVFREVWRVLRGDGTCWVNFGDSYATGAGSCRTSGGDCFGKQNEVVAAGAMPNCPPNRMKISGIKPKEELGIPWRVAFALQADGWYLRSDIIWNKPNPMPESVHDRPTKAHEYIFLLTKSERYFYDMEATLEDCSTNTHARVSQNVAAQIGSVRANGGGKINGNMKAVVRGGLMVERGEYEPVEELLIGVGDGTDRTNGTNVAERRVSPKALKTPAGWNTGKGDHRDLTGRYQNVKQNESFDASVCLPVLRRNKRTVWTVPTFSYKGAHYATFPPDLVKPCILAGTSAHGNCAKCGKPWVRVVETVKPSCDCGCEDVVKPVVLDPFGGSGTTGAVALELGRAAVLIEIGAQFLPQIEERTKVTLGFGF